VCAFGTILPKANYAVGAHQSTDDGTVKRLHAYASVGSDLAAE